MFYLLCAALHPTNTGSGESQAGVLFRSADGRLLLAIDTTSFILHQNIWGWQAEKSTISAYALKSVHYVSEEPKTYLSPESAQHAVSPVVSFASARETTTQRLSQLENGRNPNVRDVRELQFRIRIWFSAYYSTCEMSSKLVLSSVLSDEKFRGKKEMIANAIFIFCVCDQWCSNQALASLRDNSRTSPCRLGFFNLY